MNCEIINYDFKNDVNAPKWRNLFVQSLKKILYSVHNDVNAEDEALVFIESLMLRLMSLLVVNNPHNVQELEERVQKLFPQAKQATEHATNTIREFDNAQCSQSSQHHLHNPLIGGTLTSGKKKKLLLVNIPNSFNNYSNSNALLNLSLVTSSIIEKLHDLLSKEVFPYKIDIQLTIYLCSLLEYIAADILKLAGNYVKNICMDNVRLDKISAQDVKIAMNASPLFDLFYSEEGDDDVEKTHEGVGGVGEEGIGATDDFVSGDVDDGSGGPSYAGVVKELLVEEKQFIRDLNLIIKVFLEPFTRMLMNTGFISGGISIGLNDSAPNTPTSISSHVIHTPTSHSSHEMSGNCESSLLSENDFDDIFSNIKDVYEFSIEFLGQIEDTQEMCEKGDGIGMCFYEMAENMEFEVFNKFTSSMMIENSPQILPEVKLNELLKQLNVVSCLETGGHKFVMYIKYLLPKLLVGPVVHCLHYFEYISLLKSLATSETDKYNFTQCEGLMKPLRLTLKKLTRGKNLKINEGYVKFIPANHRSRCKSSVLQKKIEKMSQMIDGFDMNTLANDCNEFIFEGSMHKVRKNERKTLARFDAKPSNSERYCFLFDTMLIACKPVIRDVNRDSATEYKLKEKFYTRKLDVLESDLDANAFEIVATPFKAGNWENKGIVFSTKTLEERNIWMGNLLLLSKKSTLERTLDSILAEEEKQNPLRLPSLKTYIFAEKDSPDNIVFETSVHSTVGSVPGNDLIKGATLTKLIERLTFHQPMDAMFVKIFLTVYRSFCSPQQLLSLLIQRFDIPELDREGEDIPREAVDKFKKGYMEPIQFRVINVIKHWIDLHYYDFENDYQLLETLTAFLERACKERQKLIKWIKPLLNKITKKNCHQDRLPSTSQSINGFEGSTFLDPPPPIEHWLYTGLETREEINLMIFHPLEFARQLTLYESELYRAVKPSELIGLKWTKDGKEIHSANLLKISRHSNHFTYWLEKEIVDTANFEERLSLLGRIIEIMQVLYDLNNFNGILEIISALDSACIHRLEHTFSSLSDKHQKILRAMKELSKDHHRKYYERLRSINPPCVPFFGLYQTQILHLEEGNNDFIDVEKGLINFSKRRKIAEITTEIQGYQMQRYNLSLCHGTRTFLESLDPIGEDQTEKEFMDYLYKQSLVIEPRGSKTPTKGTRRWVGLNLKSPGIKPSSSSSSHHHSHSSSNMTSAASILLSASSSNPTSPTLTSPKTPPSTTSDSSVFANVIIGAVTTPAQNSPPISYTPTPMFTSSSMGSSSISIFGGAMQSPSYTTPTAPPPPPPQASLLSSSSTSLPPQVPPRSTRIVHQRNNSESSVTSATTSPTSTSLCSFPLIFNYPSDSIVPTVLQPPPPPPPRIPRSSTTHQPYSSIASNNSGTIAVNNHQTSLSSINSSNSVDSDENQPPPLPPRGIGPQSMSQSFRQTLPRRNSIESHSSVDCVNSTFHRRNSSTSQPQLPPKTYRSNRP